MSAADQPFVRACPAPSLSSPLRQKEWRSHPIPLMGWDFSRQFVNGHTPTKNSHIPVPQVHCIRSVKQVQLDMISWYFYRPLAVTIVCLHM